MSLMRVILLAGGGYFVWRVTQQPGTSLPNKINQAAREFIRPFTPALQSDASKISKTLPQPNAFSITALLDLIAHGEANHGYDSYYNLARPPSKPISQMTISEVQAWQRNTHSRSTAVGRYQFIQSTLAELVRQTRTPSTQIFNATIQDGYAVLLLQRHGLDNFRAGLMSAEDFAARLAQVWAALPSGPDNVSYYSGVAGNRARIVWDDVIRILRGGL